MYSQIIRKNYEKSDIINESVENAINCIQQSIKIISSNLLELKSINPCSMQILDFEQIVKKGVEMSKIYAAEKNIEFETIIKNSGKIEADENRLLACIVNIIKNGIEAIEIKGKISVIGEMKEQNAVIKITNDGKPISKDKQQTIFTTGYTTKKTGCGIGLALCKRYLNEQNGEIELVKSGKGQTSFEIRLKKFS